MNELSLSIQSYIKDKYTHVAHTWSYLIIQASKSINDSVFIKPECFVSDVFAIKNRYLSWSKHMILTCAELVFWGLKNVFKY